MPRRSRGYRSRKSRAGRIFIFILLLSILFVFIDAQVSPYLETAIENQTRLMSTKAINEAVEEQLQKSKKEEVNLGEAIVAAQKTADRIKSLAREESNMIVEEARNNANAIVHEALLTAEKTEHEAMILRKNITVYKNRVKNIIKSQLEIAEDLDKYDLDN